MNLTQIITCSPRMILRFFANLERVPTAQCTRQESRSTGEIFAIKVIQLSDDDEGISSTTIRELSILQSLNHPNIIKMKAFKIHMLQANPKIELYFEFMDEDLAKMMRRVKTVDPSTTRNIMRQILSAANYMHQNHVFHRDLKPQNILINKEEVVKIADFGLGRITGTRLSTMSKEIETLWYRAPELLLGNLRYDYSVDVWSLGCIFYELAEGKVRYQKESEIGQIMTIMEDQGTPSVQEWKEISHLPFFKPSFPKFKKTCRTYKNLDPHGVDLLESMLALNPKKRISIGEARKHKYFDSN